MDIKPKPLNGVTEAPVPLTNYQNNRNKLEAQISVMSHGLSTCLTPDVTAANTPVSRINENITDIDDVIGYRMPDAKMPINPNKTTLPSVPLWVRKWSIFAT